MSIPKMSAIPSDISKSTGLIKIENISINISKSTDLIKNANIPSESNENFCVKKTKDKIIVTEIPYSRDEGKTTYNTTEYDWLGRIISETSIDQNDKTGVITAKRYTEYNNNEQQTKYIVEKDIDENGNIDFKSKNIAVYDDNGNLREARYISDKDNDGQIDCTIITKYDEHGKAYECKKNIYENGEIKISENLQ